MVSAASGAVGSVVGQIARIKDCRAVGVAGSPEKCAYVVDELGFDACVNYKSATFRDDLAAACPRGIDVYFENVGGAVQAAVFKLLNRNARIPLCGFIADYNATEAPRGPGLRPLLVSRAMMKGFIVSDHAESHRRFPARLRRLGQGRQDQVPGRHRRWTRERAGRVPEAVRRDELREADGPSLARSDQARRLMTMLESIAQDLRFALRALGRTRGVTATAVLTLALGVGATAVMFSVVYGLLISPLPYRDIDRSVVVTLRGVTDVGGWKGRTSFSYDEFAAFRAGSQVFEDLMGGGRTATVLYEDGGSTRVFRGAQVTSNAFDYLGVPPLLGRSFTDADGQPGAPAVFAMNDRLWRSEFGGDPAIIGQTFRLNGSVATLVAVMPARFQIYGADLWMPMAGREWGAGLALMGRLKPGVSVPAAAADLDAIAQRFAAANPSGNFPDRFITVVRPYLDTVVGDFRNTLYGLLAAVLLLLGIACSNVANLLLARATVREREVAVRAALGASRSRLLRHLLVECLVLATAAATAGLGLAWLGLRLVVALMPAGMIPAETVIELNAPVLALSMVIAVATALLCGLAPALHLVDADLQSRAGAGSRSTGAPAPARCVRSWSSPKWRSAWCC